MLECFDIRSTLSGNIEPMTELDGKQVLREVELAIHEQNYGRLYDLGINLVKKAANDNAWLEAVVIITGYLVKSRAHLWDAVDLSKRAALQAPEQTRLHEFTTQSLVLSINAFSEPEDRVKASYSVVCVAPKGSALTLICLDLILDNIPDVKEPTKRKQYIKMVIFYSPKDSSVTKRAEILMIQTHAEIQKQTRNNDTRASDGASLLGFLDKHAADVHDFLRKKVEEK